jgi:hypothetical protein
VARRGEVGSEGFLDDDAGPSRTGGFVEAGFLEVKEDVVEELGS